MGYIFTVVTMGLLRSVETMALLRAHLFLGSFPAFDYLRPVVIVCPLIRWAVFIASSSTAD